MDASERCGDGGLAGITQDVLTAREKFVFDWCAQRALPVAFALAGGYIGAQLDQHALVALHRLTLHAAASSS